MEKNDIKAIIEKLNLSVTFVFVPFSQSRNKGEKNLSLNYLATVLYKGKEVFTCNYQMGIAYVPLCEQGKLSIDDNNAIKQAVETGKSFKSRDLIIPDTVNFFYCISSDCDVLNYASFENWADDMGIDADSREREKIYRKCLEQTLKLRNVIGENGLQELQEAFQDH